MNMLTACYLIIANISRFAQLVGLNKQSILVLKCCICCVNGGK